MEFQAALVVAIGHDSVTNSNGDFTLVDDTVGPEVFRCARLNKFFSVDKDVEVRQGVTLDGERADGDGICGNTTAIKNDIL